MLHEELLSWNTKAALVQSLVTVMLGKSFVGITTKLNFSMVNLVSGVSSKNNIKITIDWGRIVMIIVQLVIAIHN